MPKHPLKRHEWSYRTITIEIDDRTVKGHQAAAERAGLTIDEYLRQLAGHENSPTEIADRNLLQKELEELSVDYPSS